MKKKPPHSRSSTLTFWCALFLCLFAFSRVASPSSRFPVRVALDGDEAELSDSPFRAVDLASRTASAHGASTSESPPLYVATADERSDGEIPPYPQVGPVAQRLRSPPLPLDLDVEPRRLRRHESRAELDMGGIAAAEIDGEQKSRSPTVTTDAVQLQAELDLGGDSSSPGPVNLPPSATVEHRRRRATEQHPATELRVRRAIGGGGGGGVGGEVSDADTRSWTPSFPALTPSTSSAASAAENIVYESIPSIQEEAEEAEEELQEEPQEELQEEQEEQLQAAEAEEATKEEPPIINHSSADFLSPDTTNAPPLVSPTLADVDDDIEVDVASAAPAATESSAYFALHHHYEPQQLHLAFAGHDHGMSLSWVQFYPPAGELAHSSPALPPLVEYAACDGSFTHRENAITRSYRVGDWQGEIYHVLMQPLQSDQLYVYRIIDGDLTTQWMPFYSKRRPSINKAHPFTAAVYGDLSTSSNAARTLQQIQLQNWKIAQSQRQSLPCVQNLSSSTPAGGLDMILHLGDLGYSRAFGKKWDIAFEWFGREKQQTWDLFGHMISPLSSTIPYMVAPGNHETGKYDFDFIPYSSRFNMPLALNLESGLPERKLYYSYDWGPVHIVVLNSEQSVAPLSEQATWFEKDLRQNQKREQTTWTVVAFHRPIYSSDQDSGSDLTLRAQLEPLLVQYSVDVFFTGHDHSYERTYPVAFDQVLVDQSVVSLATRDQYVDPVGPVHLRIGTGGIQLGVAWQRRPLWSAVRLQQFGFVMWRVFPHNHTMSFEFVSSVDGSTLDQFTVVKQRRVPNAQFFALPEDRLSNSGGQFTMRLFGALLVMALLLIVYAVYRQRRSEPLRRGASSSLPLVMKSPAYYA